MSNRIHSIFADCLAIVAGGSGIAAWQEQVEWGLRIIAALVAIAAGIASLMHRRRGRRRDD